jgi:hypothetical protein
LVHSIVLVVYLLMAFFDAKLCYWGPVKASPVKVGSDLVDVARI